MPPKEQPQPPNPRGQPQGLAYGHSRHGFLGPWRSWCSTPRFDRRAHRQTVPPDSQRPAAFALPPPLGGGLKGPLQSPQQRPAARGQAHHHSTTGARYPTSPLPLSPPFPGRLSTPPPVGKSD